MTKPQLKMLCAFATPNGPGLITHSALLPLRELMKLGYVQRDWKGEHSITEAGRAALSATAK